jgi:hypothetical protein
MRLLQETKQKGKSGDEEEDDDEEAEQGTTFLHLNIPFNYRPV